MSVLIFILVLSFLVLIHELGHFIAARRAGIPVEEFGLGYPPRLIKLFTWKKTVFSLNWIPFGGFVRLQGEDDPQGEFQTYSAAKRLQVVLAGAIVNFVFGILAFSLIFSVTGIPQPLDQPRIAEVAAESPAEETGLQPQTEIVAFAVGEEHFAMDSTTDVIEFVDEHQGETLKIITTGPCKGLSCDTETTAQEIYLRKDEEIPEDQGSMGIVFKTVILRHYPWYEMPFRGTWYGLEQAFWLGQVILEGLGQVLVDLITLSSLPQEIAGPIGIVHQAATQEIFAEGWLAILSFAGMLSINLAVLNLLPMPALDGGRAVFIALGSIFNSKKLNEIEHWANYLGFIFLLGLLILVTIRDVGRVFGFAEF